MQRNPTVFWRCVLHRFTELGSCWFRGSVIWQFFSQDLRICTECTRKISNLDWRSVYVEDRRFCLLFPCKWMKNNNLYFLFMFRLLYGIGFRTVRKRHPEWKWSCSKGSYRRFISESESFCEMSVLPLSVPNSHSNRRLIVWKLVVFVFSFGVDQCCCDKFKIW